MGVGRPWHVNQSQTNPPFLGTKGLEKHASRHLTSPQTPAFYIGSGRRKVSMGIKPNKEVLHGATGVISDPGGPHPAGMFWFFSFFFLAHPRESELNWTELLRLSVLVPDRSMNTQRHRNETRNHLARKKKKIFIYLANFCGDWS